MSQDHAAVHAAHVARWAALDPAIAPPPPLALAPSAENPLAVRRPDGSAALGVSEWSQVDATSPVATFRALGEHRLRARVSGPDARGAFGDLLDLWIARVEAATIPARDADGRPDPVLALDWPSRDVEATSALLSRGFRPTTVLAVRPVRPVRPVRAPGPGQSGGAGASAPGPAGNPGPAEPRPSGATIRDAAPDDLDAVLDMQLAEIRYDELVGAVRLRQETADVLRVQLAAALARPHTTLLLAVVDGEPVGLAGVEAPESSAWAGTTLAYDRVAYLVVLHVRADRRGRGIGGRLTARALAHADARLAPGDAVVLHHGVHNPLSAPFWAARGFRPAQTAWERPVGGAS